MNEIVIGLFVAGYLLIACEQALLVNKAASALLTGVACWAALLWNAAAGREALAGRLAGHVGEIAGIIFFLLGAMTLVELIDAHGGFQVITRRIRPGGPRAFLWLLGFATFLASAVLDNLTTTIVALAVMRRIVADARERLYCAGAVGIAANAGGVWSPIGDVTSTMLWLGGQITAGRLVASMFLPSLVSVAVALLLITPRLRAPLAAPVAAAGAVAEGRQSVVVLVAGVLMLLQVPLFKAATHLPP
jgi:Na+/H+ antiporter NhaD/arsenite permease-like protein